jgi:hypothetical protein
LTPEAFRAAALAIRGVEARPHMDRTAFRARINFATLASDGATANVKLPPEEQELHCERLAGVTPVSGGWGRMGWTTVDLARVNDDDIAVLLSAAHRNAL